MRGLDSVQDPDSSYTQIESIMRPEFSSSAPAQQPTMPRDTSATSLFSADTRRRPVDSESLSRRAPDPWIRRLALVAIALSLWAFFGPLPHQVSGFAERAEDSRPERPAEAFPLRLPSDKALAKEAGRAIALEALRHGEQSWSILADWMPNPAETIAMLARDRDVDTFEETSEVGGVAGEHYKSVVDLVPVMRPLRDTAVAFFSAIHETMVRTKIAHPSDGSLGPVTREGKSSPPRKRDMDYSHTFALDIFLQDVEELPGSLLERGPEILSVSGGIVICAASDWTGGPGIDTYEHGGISPNAGNGVIVFDPTSQRFYSYFHLYDVLVSPGMAISQGTVLGRGGDTGSNARKRGHGQHLHLEIFDMREGRFLRNTEIKDLIF